MYKSSKNRVYIQLLRTIFYENYPTTGVMYCLNSPDWSSDKKTFNQVWPRWVLPHSPVTKDSQQTYFLSRSFIAHFLLDASVDPQCCKLGEDPDPATCLVRAMKFSVSSISSSFHSLDACIIEFYKCCYRKFEMGKNSECCMPHDKVSRDWRTFY